MTESEKPRYHSHSVGNQVNRVKAYISSCHSRGVGNLVNGIKKQTTLLLKNEIPSQAGNDNNEHGFPHIQK